MVVISSVSVHTVVVYTHADYDSSSRTTGLLALLGQTVAHHAVHS
jgi:hypothetical protein